MYHSCTKYNYTLLSKAACKVKQIHLLFPYNKELKVL